MADSTEQHSTLAGARLDPNLAGGQGLSGGSSVVDTDRVHQEGIDHIKAHSGLGSESSSAMPASNPGESESAGLAPGQGGVSSSAFVQSPVSTTTTSVATTEQDAANGGIVGTVKSYLGFGPSSSSPSTATTTITTTTHAPGSGEEVTSNVADAEPIENAATSAEQTTATSAGYDTLPANGGQQQGYLAAAGGALASAAAATGLYKSSSTDNAGVDPTERNTMRTDDDLTSTDDARRVADSTATDEAEDPNSTDAGMAGASKADVGEDEKPPKPADKGDNSEAGAAAKRENKSAIPTAGGQRLGEQHWGESKMVPDLPPKQGESESKAGVSSSDGQPTGMSIFKYPQPPPSHTNLAPPDQVRDNTAANQGAATGGPAATREESNQTHGSGGSQGEGKQKLTDKIKDKLHMGSKE